MSKEGLENSILISVNKAFDSLTTMDEDYLKKNLYYKEFKFQEDNFAEIVDMLAKIQYTITFNEKEYSQLLDKKLLDAQESLIKACNDIYSERIKLNPKLQQLVQSTIIPYYHGRFEIGFSREISFLPLELRLYIYTSLLSIEASTIRQMHLIDRIALTLHKAGESFLGDISIFISSWLKSKLSEQISRQKLSFSSSLQREIKSINKTSKLRQRILTDAQMTPEIAGQEFWYGFKGLSNLSNIHNIEVAKICLDIFTLYFEGSFSLVKEIQPLLIEYYKTRNSSKIDKLIKKEGLDEVTIVRRYTNEVYNSNTVEEMGMDYSQQLDEYQKLYVQKVHKNYKEYSYLYINPSMPKVSSNTLKIPQSISQVEAVMYIENLEHILRFKRIPLSTFNEYILNLSTSIMNSKDWDLGTLNIVIGSLANIYGMVWFRNSQDTYPLLSILVNILRTKNKDEIPAIGTGWPVSIILEDSANTTKKFVVFKSKNQYINSFVGLTYVTKDPLSLSEGIIEEILMTEQNQQIYWERIEKNPYLTKSKKQKRHKIWAKMRKARNEEISKNYINNQTQTKKITSENNKLQQNINNHNSIDQKVEVKDFSSLPYFDGFIFEGYIDKKNKQFIWRYFINHKIDFNPMSHNNLNNLIKYARECLYTGNPFMVKGDKPNELWAASHPMQIESAYGELSQIIEQIK
ncbi:hypothetical protein GLV94_08050 [Virgibacillus halodenitrificans]|uniref:hypothetical protein n=1 Tax=Virgibacillus halodenitrificans TaxID=1482 RepID=UPI00137215A2|nr:hypothetical protein [Virgibacillus halodenitrificans]MYL45597.1 hypothetical protein [Virgibacillus halodenitrificans]